MFWGKYGFGIYNTTSFDFTLGFKFCFYRGIFVDFYVSSKVLSIWAYYPREEMR